MTNLCGKCNVCCVIYRIDKSDLSWRDTDKEKDEICDKLINDRCVRHKNRPKACRSYECVWLQLSKLSKSEWCPLKWRPDNLGLVVVTSYDKNTFVFKIEEIEKGKMDFNDPEIDSFLKMIFKLEKQQKGNTRVDLYFHGEDKGHQITQNKRSI